MFIKPTLKYGTRRSQIQIFHSLQLVHPIEHVAEQILRLFDIRAQFAHIDSDISNLAKSLRARFPEDQQVNSPIKIELIKSLFFRNKCAYIVGRIVKDYTASPFIIPLLHDSAGVYVDAVLLDSTDASSIFSYSIAYFLTDTDMALNMVEFLHSILPKKSLSELYNSLGFIKHAKTEFYREFEYHMEHTEDEFIIAPGIKGMVMTVFTLPSYNMVFKVIKDKFDPPKKVTERIVKEKYQIVSRHDRVGRMVDSHEFRNLHFDIDRFSVELLDELKKTIPTKITITGNRLTISHLYIEKKLIPLDIYLSKSNKIQQEQIMIDYGKAIKELAGVSIFPGDLLLKNFGVNRHKKVVFYDYDEIEYVTDLSFKKIPQTKNDEDDWMADSWFTPNLNDVYPEQFPRFIVGNKRLQNILLEEHNEIFDSDYWKDIQKKIKNGALLSIFPYDTSLRFLKATNHR